MTIIDKIDGVWAETGAKEATLTDEKKSVGHVSGDRPLRERLNYLQYRADVKIDEIIDYIEQNVIITNICNWQTLLADTGSGFHLTGIIYHPVIKRWIAVEGSGSTSYYVFASIDGHKWEPFVHQLSTWAQDRCIAIDLTRYLIPTTNNDIEYSTDGDVTWGTETDATIGGSGNIKKIATKYPDSNFTMLVREPDNIRIASTGIGGGWVAPTTPPDNTGNIAKGFLYLGGTSWVLMAYQSICKTHISTDDGDTWTATSYNPDMQMINIGYNPDSGTLLACGNKTGVGLRISRSTDLGVTPWVNATFLDGADGPPTFSTGNNLVYDIIYCDKDTWVAAGTAGADLYGFWVSRDDGVTWRFIYVHKQTVGETLKPIRAIAKSENQLIAVGDNGRALRSLSLADAFTF